MNLRILVWAFSAIFSATLAHAQTTNVELLAMFGGRIIGGAKACGIKADRVRRAGEKVLLLVKSRALSEAEQKSATGLFTSEQKVGGDNVRAEKTRCTDVHVEFSEIEVKLAKYPGGDSDAVAARRPRLPVQPLGALRPDIAGSGEKR